MLVHRELVQHENWDRLYEGWKARMTDLIRETEAIRVPELPGWNSAEATRRAAPVAERNVSAGSGIPTSGRERL